MSNQPEPQRHAAPEFNALPPIRKPALCDRPVPELAIRHTQAWLAELPCRVLRLDGTRPLPELVKEVCLAI